MLVEVHVSESPARRGWLLASAIALFALAVGLAYSMAHSQNRPLLADRVELSSWGLSFRPPVHFKAPRERLALSEDILVLDGFSREGAPLRLSLWRTRASEPKDAAATAEGFWEEVAREWLPFGYEPPPEPDRRTIADHPAAMLTAPGDGLAICSLVAEDDVVFFVVLEADGGRLTDRTVQLFEEVCQSIQFAKFPGSSAP